MCTNLGMGLDMCDDYKRMVKAYAHWSDEVNRLAPMSLQSLKSMSDYYTAKNRRDGYDLEMQEHIGRSTEAVA